MTQLLFYITILYSLLLFVTAWRKKQFNPATFFTLFWSGQIIFILLGWSNYLYFNYTGIIYILFLVTCFDIGYQTIKVPSKIKGMKSYGYSGKKSLYVYLFVLFFAFVSMLYNIVALGFNIEQLLSFDSFVEMSHDSSVDRYSGEEQGGGLVYKILAVNAYACPLMGGFMYHYFKGWKKIFSFAALLPVIIGGLAQGVKMGIITGTFLFMIGFVVSSMMLNIRINIKGRHILYAIVGVIGFLMLLMLSMMFRIGRVDLDTLQIVSGKMISYSLGHLPAFDIWFAQYHDNINNLTLGAKTFYGISNPLGILKREQGVFTVMYEVSPYGDMTNVFTVFRLIIEDFGLFGSPVYLFIMGIISKAIYTNFQLQRHIFMNATLLCAEYFFITWSFVTSIFAYTTYIAMVVYLFLLIRIIIVKKYENRIKTN